MQLAKNVRDRNPDLARKARRRAVELRAIFPMEIKTKLSLNYLRLFMHTRKYYQRKTNAKLVLREHGR